VVWLGSCWDANAKATDVCTLKPINCHSQARHRSDPPSRASRARGQGHRVALLCLLAVSQSPNGPTATGHRAAGMQCDQDLVTGGTSGLDGSVRQSGKPSNHLTMPCYIHQAVCKAGGIEPSGLGAVRAFSLSNPLVHRGRVVPSFHCPNWEARTHTGERWCTHRPLDPPQCLSQTVFAGDAYRGDDVAIK